MQNLTTAFNKFVYLINKIHRIKCLLLKHFHNRSNVFKPMLGNYAKIMAWHMCTCILYTDKILLAVCQHFYHGVKNLTITTTTKSNQMMCSKN